MINKKEEHKNFRFFKKLSKFEKGELNNFVKMDKEIKKGKNKMNNKIKITEDINSSCLDYVLVALSVAPYLKDELDNLISDINEEPNTSGISRYWEKEEVLKVTALLKALK